MAVIFAFHKINNDDDDEEPASLLDMCCLFILRYSYLHFCSL